MFHDVNVLTLKTTGTFDTEIDEILLYKGRYLLLKLYSASYFGKMKLGKVQSEGIYMYLYIYA